MEMDRVWKGVSPCMKRFLLSLLIASSAFAQDLPPELKSLAEKRDADLAAVQKGKETALATVKAPYLATLNQAESKATQAGKTDVLKGILDEKEAVSSNAPMPPVPLPVLPREVYSARSTYLREAARLSQATAPKLNQIRSDYLRSLGDLELRARQSKNQELLKAITAEKLKTVEDSANAKTAEIPTSTGKNQLINGDFLQRKSDGTPESWSLHSKTTSIVPESSFSFLRVDSGYGEQTVSIPPGAHSVTISGNVRYKNSGTSVGCRIYGSVHPPGSTKEVDIAVTEIGSTTLSWKHISSTSKIPAGCSQINVGYYVNGNGVTLDLRDIRLEFH